MSREDFGTGRLDLGAALGSAVRTLPRMWRGAWLALAWAASASISSVFVWGPAAAVSGVLAFAFGWIAFVALLRVAMASDLAEAKSKGLGLGGLQLGKPEFRVLGAGLLCLLFLSMIAAILDLVVLAIFGSAELDLAALRARDFASAGPAWQLVLLSLVGLGGLAVPILLAVRLSLFGPATIGRGHMVSLAGMRLTRGVFWPLLGGLVVTALPGVLIAFATAGLAGEAPIILRAIGVWFVQAPLIAAFITAAYRQLETWTPEGGRT